jgi:hypothetical protein
VIHGNQSAEHVDVDMSPIGLIHHRIILALPKPIDIRPELPSNLVSNV